MISELLPPNPRVDAVIAPDDEPEDPSGITSSALYRWCLIAAVHKDHPIAHRSQDHTIDIEELTRYPIAASPARHRTRELLESHQSSFRMFDVSFVSPEPAALVAMGHGSGLVPVIASDSSLPVGPWLGTRAVKPATRVKLPPWWRAIRAGDEVLGGAYRLYWRLDDSPKGMPAIIDQLAAQLRDGAEHLNNRIEPWKDELPKAIRP